ncbi:uncharacterized protein B0P05DRAFT_529644 [Gilbertella persicaria]|uniref:uncharacterized protein n=1 Tax=Gilbertella persicaria TaxID=101096 RepID=UPI00221FABB9|nr:uncharacterized protein B0P05DRAFT_529644 [Gilbertella persicaria]KAI8090178.1 hypothetical protein B0P05DRAFT_529644 [Gilbertella persicaria]
MEEFPLLLPNMRFLISIPLFSFFRFLFHLDMLIYLALFFFFLLLCWYFRQYILDAASFLANKTNRLIGYHLLPTNAGSFEEDIEDGLTSSQFDLHANMDEQDTRAGLKDKEEIMRIMKKQKVSFDEARLIRQQRLLKKNNIDPETGLPLDPKFVSF